MHTPILPNTQDLSTWARDADDAAPGMLQRLLTRAVESLADDDEVAAMLARADEYQASAPGFADELRLAATASVTTRRAVAA